jgi:hypothetical protein
MVYAVPRFIKYHGYLRSLRLGTSGKNLGKTKERVGMRVLLVSHTLVKLIPLQKSTINRNGSSCNKFTFIRGNEGY